MKKIYLALALCLSFISLQAQKITLNTQQLSKIDSIVNASYKENLPGLSYLVAQGNQILLQKTIGMSEMEFGIKSAPDHVFAIGSVSKQFTAIAMLKLVEMGKVKLDADVKTYLSDYNTHGQKISIANLLSHTSGISSFTEMESFSSLYKEDKSKEEIRKAFEDSSLLFNPTTNWSYSNSGYVLAGLIIEKVSGMDLHEFMQKYLFDVAGMKNTYFGSNTKIYGKKAYGYDQGEKENTVNKTTEYSWTWPLGAGDILSTTGDLFLWHKALSEGKIISKENVNLAFTNYKLNDGRLANYGFGWGICKLGNKTIIEHGGAIGGFLSATARIEEDQIYIILLSNNTSVSPSDVLSNILLSVLNLPKNPNKSTLTQNYKDLEGSYEVNYIGGRITSNSGKDKIYRYITTEDGKLYIQRTGRSKVELLPYDKDAFFMEGGAQRFVFLRDKKNKVTALDVSSYPLQLGPSDVCKKTDAPLPSSNVEIKVAAEILKKYIGTYQLAPNFLLEVTVEGTQIFCQATGQQKFEIFPKSETSFFLKVIDAKIDFNMDASGNVLSLFLTQGRKMEAKKVK